MTCCAAMTCLKQVFYPLCILQALTKSVLKLECTAGNFLLRLADTFFWQCAFARGILALIWRKFAFVLLILQCNLRRDFLSTARVAFRTSVLS